MFTRVFATLGVMLLLGQTASVYAQATVTGRHADVYQKRVELQNNMREWLEKALNRVAYPYDILVTFTEPPLTETEPNDSCATANAAFLGDNFLSSIAPVGDRDSYLLSVPADGFIEMEASGPSGDTVMKIESAGAPIIRITDVETDSPPH